MLERDPGLLETTGHDHGFAPRHGERPVQRRRGDPAQQGRLAVAAPDRQRGGLDGRRERAPNEAPLPGQNSKRLAGPAPLRNGQAFGEVSAKGFSLSGTSSKPETSQLAVR